VTDLKETKEVKELHHKGLKDLKEIHQKVVKEMLDLLQRESRVPKVSKDKKGLRVIKDRLILDLQVPRGILPKEL
jgi:hypothetical protein